MDKRRTEKPLFLTTFFTLALTFTSCATTPARHGYTTVEYDVQLPSSAIGRVDMTHIVAPGETLWRLSKIYSVNIEDIMRANNLKSPKELEIGQRLMIPKAMPIRPIVPLYPSAKWKYIIIHHSATDSGSALSLFKMHLRRGFWNGLGYDFVVANGTYGKADGQIEIAPRWIKQEDGAHCKASGMNHNGIGICLVGNFSKEQVSGKQMDSLVYLVKTLKDYYDIPASNIMGHGQVPGARTECPGTKFPWGGFWKRLKG